ncbi:hypothetical protein P167DRAFT_184905 [Morchella conica CCBAS932]|uniref:Uncharacterized protein n=1 Tax=Morchella conica CCBAS932 TaxID=1392247 RepID=A0A3N4KMJ0_9PEZI|nr:hypothetical protein P167DRAFT_184905 [Morchella conica CCBAS932]
MSGSVSCGFQPPRKRVSIDEPWDNVATLLGEATDNFNPTLTLSQMSLSSSGYWDGILLAMYIHISPRSRM